MSPKYPLNSKTKVLAVASGGGHWVQLRRLYGAFEGLDVAFVSLDSRYSEQVQNHRYYTVRDVTRWDRWGFVVLAFQFVRIFLVERPTVVITTGSAPGLVALALAKKVFGTKTIWIDSIANCERVSASGTYARRFADIWLTQWSHLQTPAGPHYWGAVL
jgi:UDP-N-acetylglucosamine:LPS N-acetylglucosamine transferase